MLALNANQNGYRLLLPKNFICDEIQEKYSELIRSKHSFFTTPIDFLNETIQQVEILGFNEATVLQQQTVTGAPLIHPERVEQNRFQFPLTDYSYRKEVSPLNLVDRTLNIQFRHTIGYLSYFMLFENFWYLYTRDRAYDEMCHEFNIDLFNENGVIYSRIVIQDPLINSMDMLQFNFGQPVAQSSSFKVEFKYNNLDYQFIEIEPTINNNPENVVSTNEEIYDDIIFC